MDQRRLKSLIDFVTKGIDVHVNDITHTVEMNIPDVLYNHCPRDSAIRIAEQEFKQRILFHLQIDDLSGAANLARGCVHFKIGNMQLGVFLSASPE
jgi:hypothetical protein